MKRCRTCLHVTAGDPTFCPACGGSYDKRICPKGHANPRSNNVCGECGSRELSHAQPRRRLSLAAGFGTIKLLIGVALLAGTIVFAIAFAVALIRDPTQLLGWLLIGLGLALCWLAFVSIG